MERYTKSDQYYADEYDQETVERMKELEKLIPEPDDKFYLHLSEPHQKREFRKLTNHL